MRVEDDDRLLDTDVDSEFDLLLDSLCEKDADGVNDSVLECVSDKLGVIVPIECENVGVALAEQLGLMVSVLLSLGVKESVDVALGEIVHEFDAD